jgi:hypothetical protein
MVNQVKYLFVLSLLLPLGQGCKQHASCFDQSLGMHESCQYEHAMSVPSTHGMKLAGIAPGARGLGRVTLEIVSDTYVQIPVDTHLFVFGPESRS